jgi:hypothetical protein
VAVLMVPTGESLHTALRLDYSEFTRKTAPLRSDPLLLLGRIRGACSNPAHLPLSAGLIRRRRLLRIPAAASPWVRRIQSPGPDPNTYAKSSP